jgi:hypothetical protein
LAGFVCSRDQIEKIVQENAGTGITLKIESSALVFELRFDKKGGLVQNPYGAGGVFRKELCVDFSLICNGMQRIFFVKIQIKGSPAPDGGTQGDRNDPDPTEVGPKPSRISVGSRPAGRA